jgi:flagellar hook-basal body complex protein FliE
MMMNSGIILAGQSPDIIGQMARGAQAAQFENDSRHTNAFRSMLQEQGAGIMQGDQNALAQMARFDPGAALGVQQTRQSMDESRQRLQLAYQQANRQAQAWAQSQDEATRERERQQLERALAMGTQAQSPEQWDQVMQSLGATDYVGQFGQRDMLIAGALGIRDALTMGQGGETFRPASPEESAQYGAAGGQFGPDGRFYPISPPSGMTIEQTPEGGFRMVQGAGVGSRADRAAAAAEDNRQASAGVVLQDIDRALELMDSATLPVSGAVGGIASGIPGTAAHDVSALIDTIGANIAFDALNRMREASVTGGALGSVTERELALLQATAGSLRQSQSQEQFRRNMTRLRDQFAAIVEGQPPSGVSAAQWSGMTGDQRASILAGGASPRQPDMAPGTPQPAPRAAQTQGALTPDAIMQMPARDLLTVDVESLDAAALDALARRLNGAGQ